VQPTPLTGVAGVADLLKPEGDDGQHGQAAVVQLAGLQVLQGRGVGGLQAQPEESGGCIEQVEVACSGRLSGVEHSAPVSVAVLIAGWVAGLLVLTRSWLKSSPTGVAQPAPTR
jgi:hypothetical protein